MNLPPLSQLTALRGAQSPAALWFIHELFRVPRFAHHPTCGCFDNHLIRLGSVALCLGCTCMTLGAIVGLALLGIVCWQWWAEAQAFGTWGFIGVGVGLYTPALIQPFVQHKVFKIVSRFLLGVAVPCLWFGAMVLLPWDGWGLLLRGVFVLVFWQTYRATQRFRAGKASDPCQRCSGAVFPFCLDNRQRLVALVRELQALARPEDQDFVNFAAAVAGLKDIGAQIEIVSLRRALQEKMKSDEEEPLT